LATRRRLQQQRFVVGGGLDNLRTRRGHSHDEAVFGVIGSQSGQRVVGQVLAVGAIERQMRRHGSYPERDQDDEQRDGKEAG
jgi:hypothetical protein